MPKSNQRHNENSSYMILNFIYFETYYIDINQIFEDKVMSIHKNPINTVAKKAQKAYLWQPAIHLEKNPQ